MSTFDNEIIQKPLYISIKILHPNYCQNFSRANDTCCYVYLKPGICILSKQVTQYYLYLTYIVKAKNPLSNEKKYIYTRMITIQIVYCVYISISEHVLGWFSPVLFIATHREKIYTIDHNASQAHVLFCDFFKQSIWKSFNNMKEVSQCITGQFSKTEVAVLSDQVRLVACRNFDIFG